MQAVYHYAPHQSEHRLSDHEVLGLTRRFNVRKGEVLASNLADTHSIGVRRPLGVVASFTPWNGANIPAWRAVLNPLAAGNTVVVKPLQLAAG